MKKVIAILACFFLLTGTVTADSLSDLSITELLDLQQAIVDELKSRFTDESSKYPIGYSVPVGVELSTTIPAILFESEKTVNEQKYTHYMLTATYKEFSQIDGYLFQTEQGTVSINPSMLTDDPVDKTIPDVGQTVQVICTYLWSYRGVPYFEYGVRYPD